MKANPRMRSGFTLVELLVVISIIATLAGVGVPVIIAQKKKGDRSEAISNIKQVGLAMFSFETDYTSYPCDSTGTTIDTASSGGTDTASQIQLSYANSNGFFLQLIKAGFIDTEKSFYAKASYTKKPDNVMTGTNALAAGECGFSYVMGADKSTPLVSSGNSGQVLLYASSYKKPSGGTIDTQGKCDPDVYDKKAVMLRLDNSATAETIKPSDQTVISGTSTPIVVFATGTNTVWGTTTLTHMVPTSR
ncbi:MAG: prepilin-type N-terminal cleavage/methylation domain-containing protein [Verrucomicrobiota bacterium]